jgi:TPR repeat protein
MYTMGKGVAQNDDEALYWYQKAAEQGLNEAKQMIKEIDNGVLLK